MRGKVPWSLAVICPCPAPDAMTIFLSADRFTLAVEDMIMSALEYCSHLPPTCPQ